MAIAVEAGVAIDAGIFRKVFTRLVFAIAIGFLRWFFICLYFSCIGLAIAGIMLSRAGPDAR